MEVTEVVKYKLVGIVREMICMVLDPPPLGSRGLVVIFVPTRGFGDKISPHL
jgi:hypothetical protein